MTVSYNQVAGRSLHRIEGLSDGLFAIALTLIVLEIRLPDPAPIRMWAYASRAGLVRAGTDPGVGGAIRRRIVVAQALYAFGAALCIVSVALSILFIVLVQLNFALGARLPLLGRV